ncbi:serine/threonine-protein kinase [Myxococcus qinghaiensis]|uniref:serine/threonine-protein kinase n=1 Tax=Myxococcus qinghaiensis TaxID=2906758 RepID=UPI0020A7AA11|nr:serine/threonine protein kinase [Myxococcus qinghaiensis]MCP3165086.1 protein kinase [Myxococcus qinghaiensis]
MSSSAAHDIPLGTVLRDTYEISGVLGRGGMGTVFLARHLRLPGRQVAIKVLRPDSSLGKDVYLRFRREAEIASRLGHPNIVEVIDFDTLEDGSPFLVMEHLRGMPLSRRMRKGAPLTLPEVFSIARQMGSALQAAHGAGVIHRDLKPGNVFLVPMEIAGMQVEHVKLLDFGISKILDSKTVQTQDAILLGTPQYMAPEQATGKNKDVDLRTDIFSFGCMVYEMLARKLPFKDGGILPELIYRIVYDPPEPLAEAAPETPEHVIRAIEKALAKRPEDRFPDVSAFIAALTGTPLRTVTPPADMPPQVVAPPAAQVPTATVQPRPIASPPSRPATVAAAPRRPSQHAPSRRSAQGEPAQAPESARRPVNGESAQAAEASRRVANGESAQAAEAARRPVNGESAQAAEASRRVANGEASHVAEAARRSAQGDASRPSASSGLVGKSVRVSSPKAGSSSPPVPEAVAMAPLEVWRPPTAAPVSPAPSESDDSEPEPPTIRSASRGVAAIVSRKFLVRAALAAGLLIAVGLGLTRVLPLSSRDASLSASNNPAPPVPAREAPPASPGDAPPPSALTQGNSPAVGHGTPEAPPSSLVQANPPAVGHGTPEALPSSPVQANPTAVGIGGLEAPPSSLVQANPPPVGQDAQAPREDSPLEKAKPEGALAVGPPNAVPSTSEASAEVKAKPRGNGSTELARNPGGTPRPTPETETRRGKETIQAGALADLELAEQALERGDPAEALHLVRRSQRTQVTGASFALMTRVHCRQKDLSNARTVWLRVPATERTQVRQYCKQYDIAL